jgi:hypothetical protein
MGLYVPGKGLTFMPGFPKESGPVGFISQSGGNAGDMVFTSSVRGIRYSKVVSYGNAADIDESELLDYLADDPETEVICTYIEGVKDGRRFFQAMKKAAAAKPVIVLRAADKADARRHVAHGEPCRFVRGVRRALPPGERGARQRRGGHGGHGGPSGSAPSRGPAWPGGGGAVQRLRRRRNRRRGPPVPRPARAHAGGRASSRRSPGRASATPWTRSPSSSRLSSRNLQIIGEAENIDVVMFHTASTGATPAETWRWRRTWIRAPTWTRWCSR